MEAGTAAGRKERVYSRAGFEAGSPREKQAHSGRLLARFDFKKIRRSIHPTFCPILRPPQRWVLCVDLLANLLTQDKTDRATPGDRTRAWLRDAKQKLHFQ